LGQGGVGFGVVGVDVVGFVESPGEGVVIDDGGEFEAPAVVGDGLDEVTFEVSEGCEGFDHPLAVGLIGGLIFGRHDADLAGEAVTVRVKGARIALRFGFDRFCFSEHWGFSSHEYV